MAKATDIGTHDVNCPATDVERLAIPFSFDVFLYLQPRHVQLQDGPNWQMYVLQNTQTGQADGVAHFFLEQNIAHSPWRAPFGGVQVAPGLAPEVVGYFLGELQHRLRGQGIHQIQWGQSPHAYAPDLNAAVQTQLLSLGYTLQHQQRNHHIPVTEIPFSALVHSSAKRRLAKCEKAGFTFQQESAASLPEAYAFLKRCRAEKQKPLSLSLAQLSQYFALFPDRYFLFTVRKEQELAAVGVAVLVSQKILNHLYPASPREFNAYSPSVLLNAGLYEFCQQQQITALDLGVSAPVHEAEENYTGLFTFKTRLGGLETWKPTYFYGG